MKEPLNGLTVAITASRRANELAHLVSAFGGVPFIAPTVGIQTNQGIVDERERLVTVLTSGKMDYVIILTSIGFQSLLLSARKAGLEERIIVALRGTTIVARSPKVSSYLEELGLKRFLQPEDSTIDAVIDLLCTQDLRNKTIAMIWHGSRLGDAVENLEKSGAHVIEFSTYNYSLEPSESGAQLLDSLRFRPVAAREARTLELINKVNSCLIDVIAFTSPPAVLNLFQLADLHALKESLIFSLNKNVIVVAIGPSTKKTLEENCVSADVVPSTFKMGPMINSLAEYISKCNTSKAKCLQNRAHQRNLSANILQELS